MWAWRRERGIGSDGICQMGGRNVFKGRHSRGMERWWNWGSRMRVHGTFHMMAGLQGMVRMVNGMVRLISRMNEFWSWSWMLHFLMRRGRGWFW